MQRLPPLRRKEHYIAEIDAARKRQKIFEERRDPFCDFEEELTTNQYDIVETPPAYAGKLTSRRYRIVQRKCLSHDPEYYQGASVAMSAPQIVPSTSKDGNTHGYSVQKPNDAAYMEYDNYRGDGNEYYEASNPAFDVVPQINLSGRNRVVHKSCAQQPKKTDLLYSQKFSVPRTHLPNNSMSGPQIDREGIAVEESNTSFHQQSPLEIDVMGDHVNMFKNDYVSNELDDQEFGAVGGGYDYFESTVDGEVQEQVEVVDDDIDIDDMLDEAPIESIELCERRYPNTHRDFKSAGPIDMHKLFELMAREQNYSNENLMDYFLSDPAMSHPLNVTGLIMAARNASPELNAQAIASLGMQVNYLKKYLSKMKQDMADLRAVCLSQDNPFFSPGRRFDPSAEVSRDWRIPAISPLAEVDLVEVAREMNSMRTGKRSARNEDLIRRFVRIVLERLVPRHMVRAFTVRDRERVRGHHPQDIGDFAKNQITGIVLDLMGLYTFSENDSRARAERAYYFQLTNRLMKCAIYDMRRMTPKKREPY